MLFVGDGPREGTVLPPIVSGILRVELDPQTRPWAHLHGGGYSQKLRFAALQAAELEARGLVAVVDSDADPRGTKLKRLQRGRDVVPVAPVPTAPGEAVPHLEAWLLDDSEAIRSALGMTAPSIPSPASVESPKRTLESIISSAGGPTTGEALGGIARALDPRRCANAQSTGFHAFVAEVKTHPGPLSRPG